MWKAGDSMGTVPRGVTPTPVIAEAYRKAMASRKPDAAAAEAAAAKAVAGAAARIGGEVAGAGRA